jgi:hypothetical protein
MTLFEFLYGYFHSNEWSHRKEQIANAIAVIVFVLTFLFFWFFMRR